MSTLTLHRVNCKEPPSFILPKHNIMSRGLNRPLASNSEHADHVAGNWFSNTSLQMTHSSINNFFTWYWHKQIVYYNKMVKPIRLIFQKVLV